MYGHPDDKRHLIDSYWGRRAFNMSTPHSASHKEFSAFIEWRKGFVTMVNSWPTEEKKDEEGQVQVARSVGDIVR